MSRKAWMNAYTKGSKALQDRLAKVHKANPEFQDFVKKHGFGGNLSVKQSGQQKKSSVATVKPVTDANPERGNLDRLAVIKAAAEKQKDRRHAASNRVSFGGELGGSFSMTGSGFRRYSEEVSLDEASLADKIRAHPGVEYYGGKDDDHMVNLKKGWHMGDGQRSFGNRNVRDVMHDLKKVVKFKEGEAKEYGIDEEVHFGDASYTMHRGGWVVKRNGKIASAVLPSEKNAKEFINSTRVTLGKKVAAVVRRKAKELARGLGSQSLATESAANRNRIRSWDSAVLPVEHDHGMTTPHPKKKLDALRAAGKHVEARELERSWLRKSMAKEKLENSK